MMLRPLTRLMTVRVEEDWLVRRDGSMFPVWFSAAPIRLEDGQGVVCAFKDASVERAEAERAARRRIIEASDAARRRLARDLHDGAQQQLITAVMNLQFGMRKLDSDVVEGRVLLATARQQAEDGIAALRDLVAGIHPSVLTNFGLRAAITALAGRTPIGVRLDLFDERLDPAVEASIYFFVSEALTNVVKHAQASEVTVSIAGEEGRLTVEVRDDGVGGADPAASGTGLAGLTDRIEALGGTMEVNSGDGVGTILAATIPVALVGGPVAGG
jgi:signal transduction histidine kinase